MTELRIDQDPPRNHDDGENNGSEDYGEHHPEHVQGSQNFFGGTPADLYHGPAPIDRDPRKKTKRNLAIAAVATTGSMAAVAALYFGAKHEVHEIAQELHNPPAGNSAPAIPGQESESPETRSNIEGDMDGDGRVSPGEMMRMNGEDFAKLDLNSRIEFKGAELAKDKPAAYAIFSEYFTPDERKVMYLPPDRLTTAQDYLNDYSTGLYLSAIQPPTPEGAENGKKLWSIVASPDSPDFEVINGMIGNSPGVASVYRALDTPFDGDLTGQTEFMGHPLNGLGGYLAYGEFVSENSETKGDRQYMLFVNYPGPDGKPVSHMTDIFSGGERGFIQEIASLPRNPS